MKPGKRVFSEVRRRRLTFLWRNRRRLLVLAVGWVLVGSVLVGGFLWAGSDLIASFLAGAWLVAGIACLGYFLQLEGSFYRRMGGTAEEWTAEEFAKLRRYGWSALHAVPFDGFNVDHAVFGPRQVLAVETKFTTQALAPDPSRGFVSVPHRYVDQARRSARKLQLLLASEGVEQQVTPVLVLWGPGVRSSDVERAWVNLDGVRVLVGARARQWRAGLRRMPWSKHPTHRARQALEQYLRRAAPGDARRVAAR